MAGVKPKDTLTIEEQNEQIARRKRDWLVGLVTPQGVVQEHYIGPDKDDHNGHRHGIDVAYYGEGRVMLTAYGEREGWTRLEDRCREDKKPKLYEAWKQTVYARMDGHPIVLPMVDPKDPSKGYDMSAIYPPSVIAQRKAGTRVAGKPKAFVPGKGMIEIEAMSDEEKAARALAIGEALGLRPEEQPGA